MGLGSHGKGDSGNSDEARRSRGGGVIYRIKNWDECQHYKDRNPPWIKLKVAIVSSQDWILWDDKSRVLAIACMALASRNNGQIDASPNGLKYLKSAGCLNSNPDLKPLIESNFLVLADCNQNATRSVSVSDSSLSVSSSEEGSVRGGDEIPADLKPSEAEIRDWLKYKTERREGYKPTGLKALFERIRKIPPDKRREAIYHSMSSGWKGIFEDKNGGRNGTTASAGYAEAKPGKYQE